MLTSKCISHDLFVHTFIFFLRPGTSDQSSIPWSLFTLVSLPSPPSFISPCQSFLPQHALGPRSFRVDPDKVIPDAELRHLDSSAGKFHIYFPLAWWTFLCLYPFEPKTVEVNCWSKERYFLFPFLCLSCNSSNGVVFVSNRVFTMHEWVVLSRCLYSPCWPLLAILAALSGFPW